MGEQYKIGIETVEGGHVIWATTTDDPNEHYDMLYQLGLLTAKLRDQEYLLPEDHLFEDLETKLQQLLEPKGLRLRLDYT